MALKDNWVDRRNDEDFVLAEDINAVANAVIDLEDKVENGAEIPTFDLIALGLPDIPVTGEAVSVETDATEIVEAFNKGAVRLIFSLFGIRCEAISHSQYITDTADNKQSLCSYVITINGLNCLVNISFHDEGIAAVFTILDGGASSWNDLTDKPFGENEDGTVTQLDNKYLAILDYVQGSNEDIYPEQTLAFSYNSTFGAYVYSILSNIPFELVEGEEYNIIWDGVENKRTAFAFTSADSSECVAVGNTLAAGGEDNGDKFAIVYDSTHGYLQFLSLETTDTHTVRIYQETPEKYMLKEEYLPDTEQPTSIDLSGFDTNGTIVETYVDGTSKTTTIEFDDNGNPTKITDGNGKVTTLTW